MWPEHEEGFGRNWLITDLFERGDGEILMMHTGGEGGLKRAMDLLGLGDLVRDVPGLEMSTPLDDDEYHAARHLAPEALRSRNRDEWIKLFHAADLAALPVLRPEEVFDDEQVVHAGVVVDIPDAEFGTLRQVGPVVRFRASSPARRRVFQNPNVFTNDSIRQATPIRRTNGSVEHQPTIAP